MAHASLDSLAKELDRILDRPFCSSCRNLGIKQRIQRLHEIIIFLLIFLEDFPVETEKLRVRVTNAANQAKSVFSYAYNNRHDSEKICQDLEELIIETDSIRQEAMQIKSSIKIPMPSSKLLVVGIEEELLEMKSRLCGGESRLEIILIVGMGGIGKTTLARYAYEDPYSVYHFDVRVWLKISQKYELRGILVSILRSIKNVFGEMLREGDYMYMKEELLKERIYRYLKGRRYLIVMDDMWETNLWDDVRRMFPDDVNGSRIMITTRELSVASYIDSRIHPHQMHLMDADQSWSLLKEKVFGKEDCPLELEKIGQVIAEKCRGLPLAIVVIAGVLSCMVKGTKESWEKIARNVSKVVYTNHDAYIEILSLSYEFLPSRLKPCFLYMGCFPENYEIRVSKLIRLWEAEGFLTSNESKEMEELGYEYVEDLAMRNLVLIDKRGPDGKIKVVKIHDLLRDLCLRKCEGENFLCTINEFFGSFPRGIENSNRLSVFCNISGCIPNMESSPMHTILLFKHWAFDSWRSFRLLKVLDGLSVTLNSSTSVIYIGELINLRYLALTCEPIRKILRIVSESLYQLHNLQTLIVGIMIRAEIQFFSLDDEYLNQWYMKFEIWRMPNLKHLILLNGFLPEESFPSMENLHTLSRIRDFKCSKRLLEMLPNLKKLGVTYSYEGTYEKGWSDYGLSNLVHLHRLEKLSLNAEPYPNLKDDLSQNLAFPVTLKKLSLSGCRLPWEDMRRIGLLPKLEVLKLKRRAFCGSEWETSEGGFCQLKALLIDSTDLHQWITESSHFPKLESLTLYECDDLKKIPYDIGEIPTLQLIEVDVRSSTMVQSAKCIEEEQRSFGNILQIRLLKSRSWANYISL